jgi:hypothetical protein
LSDVVLALAANKIDPRRARIIIYGLQVASLNHRHRTAIKEEAPEKAIVRETHRHADGTLIGPEKQTPDAEEIQEHEAPSLGRILLREVQEMRKRKAEEEARLKAEEAAKAAQQSFPFQLEDQLKDQPGVPHPDPEHREGEGWVQPSILPLIHALADSPTKRCHPERSAAKSKDPHRRCADRLAKQGPHFAVLPNHNQWTNLQKHRIGALSKDVRSSSR